MILKEIDGGLVIEAFWTRDNLLSLDISIIVADWKKRLDCPERVRVPGMAECQINISPHIGFGLEEEYGGDEVDYSAVRLTLEITMVDGRNNPFRMVAATITPRKEPEAQWTVEERTDCQGLIITGNVGGLFETGLRVSFYPASPVAV